MNNPFKMIYKSALQFNIICWLLVYVIGAQIFTEDHSKDIIGKDCKITEPIYATEFDLNPLYSDVGHKIKGEDSDILEFNVCGNSHKKCNGSDVAASFNLNGKEICFDNTTVHQPRYTNGRISFNLTGGVCNNNEVYRLIVVLICDYSSQEKEPLHILPYKNEDCEFHVMWRTPNSCHPLSAPLNSNTCQAKDLKTNHIFNLMPLSTIDNSNVTYKNGMYFLINVCKPTLYGYMQMCPQNSSICLVNTTETDLKKRYINYGTTIPDPNYENNELSMHLKSKQICPTDKNKTISSLIIFHCDDRVSSKGNPEFFAESDCVYKFTWATPYACNKVTPCVVYDPINAFVYDLSELSGKKYDVTRNNETYSFGICTSPKEPCLENAGACLTTKGQSSSMGLISNNLRLSEKGGAPYLLYESGSTCENNRKWTTKIEFICQTDERTDGPQIIENTNCTVIIQFVTKAVCQKDIKCSAYDYNENREIDLTCLKSTSNYVARIDEQLKSEEPKDVKYYLNVCRPLLPQYGLSCKGNTAACRAIAEGTKNPEHEQSLGYPGASLTIVNSSSGYRPQLKYLKGDICPHDSRAYLSSQIEFYCEPKAGKGTPILKRIQNYCHYEFEWPTNVICEKHDGRFREDKCAICNDKLNTIFDLRKLFKDGFININYDGKPLQLNVCKNDSRIEIDYAKSTVNSFFDAKAPCGKNEIINVELRLVCSKIESGSFISDSSCGLVYIMETPQICPQMAIAIEKDNVKVTVINGNDVSTSKSTGLSTLGMILITSTFVVAIMAIISFLLKKPERRHQILSLFRKGNVTIHYSRENLFDN